MSLHWEVGKAEEKIRYVCQNQITNLQAGHCEICFTHRGKKAESSESPSSGVTYIQRSQILTCIRFSWALVKQSVDLLGLWWGLRCYWQAIRRFRYSGFWNAPVEINRSIHICSQLSPKIAQVLALKVLNPRKLVSPRQTKRTDHSCDY